jgi:Tfp pilus assembly protein PilO
MTSYLDRLNLRPFEKRLVVGVAVVVFLVFNFWFVFPHFSDLSRAQTRKAEALKKLQRWQSECDQLQKYRAAIAGIIGESADVPPEDQQHRFLSDIQKTEADSGVSVLNAGTTTTRTNEFFLELTRTIQAKSGEPQLVNFLHKLGAGGSLIRVRSLTLKPDQPRHQLEAWVTLVASYQKNPPKKPASAVQTASTKSAPAPAKRP